MDIGGSTVSKATLSNTDYIKDMDLAIGDQIEVIKPNDIIPRVERVTERTHARVAITVPAVCPICQQTVGRRTNTDGDDSVALYCLNEACGSRATGRLDRFMTSLKILGAGEEVIAALVESGLVNDVADLYSLNQKRARLVDLMLNGKTRFGEKRADKLTQAIDAKRNLTVAELLGSLSVYQLGKPRRYSGPETSPG